MARTLVVVYSYTGTAKRLAELLCAQMDWNLGTVEDIKPRLGAIGTLRCVLDTLLERSPPIRYDGPNPAAFDQVVLVAPVWLFQLAGPMRRFVHDHARVLPEVGVIAVMGAEGGPNAAAEVAHQLGRAPLLSTSFTTRQVLSGSCVAALYAFGRAMTDMSGSRGAPLQELNGWAEAA